MFIRVYLWLKNNMMKTIKIGTRGSELALTQTGMVRDALKNAHSDLEVETVIIKTSGDWKPEDGEKRLEVDAGGKAAFAKEIEEALLAGAIDCAVHSMKDMETMLPEGLQIAHMLPREDVRDSMLINSLSNNSQNFQALPLGATVGTASVRRQAFLLNKRPDLNVVPIRGNVQTRIDKLRKQELEMDATLLAVAGLKRLGLEDEADIILSTDLMVPAAGQGAVGIETRTGDDVAKLFDTFSCIETLWRVSAERSVLRVLGASCHTPLGVCAVLDDTTMMIRCVAISLDGQEHYESTVQGSVSSLSDSESLGQALGRDIAEKLPDGFLEQVIAG